MSDVDDLTLLKHLNEEIILDCLSKRFESDRIYTKTGPLLLAMNPFRPVPSLYDVRVSAYYRGGGEGAHIFQVAQHAYGSMVSARFSSSSVVNQSILISGESGAGKTETTKLVMRYLSSGHTSSSIEQKILESNPLLEAFGNAQTLRNDNSSRFGKFIQLQFGEKASIVGAQIETYLLEKVRVSFQAEGESNFHIFYQCCAAAASVGGVVYPYPQILKKHDRYALKLNGFADASMFNYAAPSTSGSSLLQFEETIEAMRVIGMDWPEIETILGCVAGVLHVGNITFAPHSGGEASVVSDQGALCMSCALLGIEEPGILEAALTTRTIRAANDETVQTHLSCSKAIEARDSFARYIYSGIFSYLVRRVNDISAQSVVSVIGLLDVFGFEYFRTNSFEQLCINYANERLHALFTEKILRSEQELYEAEGLEWRRTDFRDNASILTMLSGPKHGLFPMLDEECRVVGGSDGNFLARLHRVHEGNKACYSTVKTSISELFVVKHFAGPVAYTVSSFLDKNKDALGVDVMAVAETSEILTQLILPVGDKSRSTVSGAFRGQLNTLVQSLESTQLSFIRCLKPNHRNIAHSYDPEIVADQLRYGGVLEAVAIARSGFPIRIEISDFVKEFGFKKSANVYDILDAFNIKGGVGRTKIFLKQIDYDRLNEIGNKNRVKAVTRIQAYFRGGRIRQDLRMKHSAATRIQSAFIASKVREYYKYVRAAIIRIQIAWRGTRKVLGLAEQMALLGAELRAAKASMKTVEAFQRIPAAPFGMRRYASVSTMGSRYNSLRGQENAPPKLRGSVQKRVVDEMTRMREIIDRMSDNVEN